jgi:hypothetical protein
MTQALFFRLSHARQATMCSTCWLPTMAAWRAD